MDWRRQTAPERESAMSALDEKLDPGIRVPVILIYAATRNGNR
jgi:hypothetical protein